MRATRGQDSQEASRGHSSLSTWSFFAAGQVDWKCWSPTDLGGKVPAWLKGSFILPTVGQFSFAGKAFQGVLGVVERGSGLFG